MRRLARTSHRVACWVGRPVCSSSASSSNASSSSSSSRSFLRLAGDSLSASGEEDEKVDALVGAKGKGGKGSEASAGGGGQTGSTGAGRGGRMRPRRASVERSMPRERERAREQAECDCRYPGSERWGRRERQRKGKSEGAHRRQPLAFFCSPLPLLSPEACTLAGRPRSPSRGQLRAGSRRKPGFSPARVSSASLPPRQSPTPPSQVPWLAAVQPMLRLLLSTKVRTRI